MPHPTAPLPDAVDLSHHLSLLSRSRKPSPLKDIIKYMYQKGMISFAGGLPHPSVFPFHNIAVSAFPADTVIDPAAPAPPAASVDYAIGRDMTPATAYSLAQGLQYMPSTGIQRLLDFQRALTERLWKPAYADWGVMGNSGSTAAWSMICQLLLERGDYILTESMIFSTSQAVFIPMGIKAVPIDSDGEGMRADALEEALANWDESKGRRPRLMYLVPVGQNPLGTTMQLERRKAIYDVAVKYDVIIVEDDPYTMLEFPEYKPGQPSTGPAENVDVDAFLARKSPSFLTIDYQGRVIRMDTFSKVLAPGSRLGWFTMNKMFCERMLRAAEVQTNGPSGFSQVIVGQLLEEWGLDGFLKWEVNMCEQYRVRRDWMLDAIYNEFDVVPAEETDVEGAIGQVVYPKGQAHTGPALMSFLPPVGGMFIWIKAYWRTHPKYAAFAEGRETPENDFEEVFWKTLIAHDVLLTPGWYHDPFQGDDVHAVEEAGAGHYRLSFSFEPKEVMDEGVRRMAKVFVDEWAPGTN
ncbi:hypothetical protein Q8F55_008021 [Vanrija albida]|uniref:Aminotransferase class I/classII large domain-containing protein n=1 Tax=Vanrija albida TaxID=181172 RepID=A0ABR3PVD2_9TREE